MRASNSRVLQAPPGRFGPAGVLIGCRTPVSSKIPPKPPKRTRSPPSPLSVRDAKNKRAYQGKDEISLPSLDPRRKQPVVLDAGPTAGPEKEAPKKQETVLSFIKGLIKD